MRVEANKQRKELYRAHKLVGKNIRLLRNVRGISQEKIADMLHMSRSCYSALENGSKIPDFITVYTLSKFYDVDLDYLLSFDISAHIHSLLKDRQHRIESLHFINRYLKLSYGAKMQISERIDDLLEQEKDFNNFPWDYERAYFGYDQEV